LFIASIIFSLSFNELLLSFDNDIGNELSKLDVSNNDCNDDNDLSNADGVLEELNFDVKNDAINLIDDLEG